MDNTLKLLLKVSTGNLDVWGTWNIKEIKLTKNFIYPKVILQIIHEVKSDVYPTWEEKLMSTYKKVKMKIVNLDLRPTEKIVHEE